MYEAWCFKLPKQVISVALVVIRLAVNISNCNSSAVEQWLVGRWRRFKFLGLLESHYLQNFLSFHFRSFCVAAWEWVWLFLPIMLQKRGSGTTVFRIFRAIFMFNVLLRLEFLLYRSNCFLEIRDMWCLLAIGSISYSFHALRLWCSAGPCLFDIQKNNAITIIQLTYC